MNFFCTLVHAKGISVPAGARKGSSLYSDPGSVLTLGCRPWQVQAMPRQVRIQYPGAMYHVMSRGNRRQDIYLDDVDRQDFLKTLAEAGHKTGWQVHAYCLMGNHFHLVSRPRSGTPVWARLLVAGLPVRSMSTSVSAGSRVSGCFPSRARAFATFWSRRCSARLSLTMRCLRRVSHSRRRSSRIVLAMDMGSRGAAFSRA